MSGVRAMAVDRDLAADAAMVEGKGAEMLGDQNDRIALAFVRTKRPRRQHAIALKAKGTAKVIKAGDKLAIAHRIGTDLQVFDHPLLHEGPRPSAANKSVQSDTYMNVRERQGLRASARYCHNPVK